MEKLFFVLAIFPGIFALPEQGAFEVNMTETQNIAVFTKSMYNGTRIAVKIQCNQYEPVEIQISWLLRWTPCAQEYADIESKEGLTQAYFTNPELLRDMPYTTVKYQMFTEPWQSCQNGQFITLNDTSGAGYTMRNGTRLQTSVVTEEKKSVDEGADKDVAAKSRNKRQAEENAAPAPQNPPAAEIPKAAVATSTAAATTTSIPQISSTFVPFSQKSNPDFHQIAMTWEDGIYLFILRIESKGATTPDPFDATVDVRMKGPRGGYISAIEWPLLPFYGVMCFVYVIFGLIWLVLSACNWRDLLRIQFWIGGVIFLGMVEKAVFFSEHESINTTGKSVRGAVLFGELVSCLKRTLARMLVIVVSLGFGIVKPRLGPMLHKVLAMGGLYFVLCALEGCLRVLRPKSEQSNQATLAAIPLAVLDAAICWWIFTGLVTTIRTLRLRRNLVKLSLYRHFTNTLIFAVVASIAFMVWSITQHKFSKCLSDWKELWVDEAFWHLLFSVILMVIMTLWRPSANNQRYAFSPLMDAADDEAGEPMITDAFDGMKMRGKGPNGSPISPKSKADEDLKWIDENIPTSVADTALPSLLDSDEEMMNTKYEMSKME